MRLRCPWVQGDDWCPLGCECVLGRMPSDSSGSYTTIGREIQQQIAVTRKLLVHSVLLRSEVPAWLEVWALSCLAGFILALGSQVVLASLVFPGMYGF